jgi:chorismate mutase
MSIHTRAETSPAFEELEPEAGAETETIASLREQIDAFDAAMAEMMVARSQLSRRIQAMRMRAGGPRVLLSRERAIRAHYRDVMGADGVVIADAVLRVCRGE